LGNLTTLLQLPKRINTFGNFSTILGDFYSKYLVTLKIVGSDHRYLMKKMDRALITAVVKLVAQ